MATVGLAATARDWSKQPASGARAGAWQWLFPAVMVSPVLAAVGCASFTSSPSFPGPHGATPVPASAGDAPVYVPQAAVPPPSAAAVPALGQSAAIAAPAASSPALAYAPPAAPPGAAPEARPFVAARPDLQSPPRIQLNPGVVVAPLNSNVILVAGVYGIDRQLMAFQRVDWSLAAGKRWPDYQRGRFTEFFSSRLGCRAPDFPFAQLRGWPDVWQQPGDNAWHVFATRRPHDPSRANLDRADLGERRRYCGDGRCARDC